MHLEAEAQKRAKASKLLFGPHSRLSLHELKALRQQNVVDALNNKSKPERHEHFAFVDSTLCGSDTPCDGCESAKKTNLLDDLNNKSGQNETKTFCFVESLLYGSGTPCNGCQKARNSNRFGGTKPLRKQCVLKAHKT